ncbi:sensor histidine kinase [Ktedonospora formicarum]|uniref:histidine kinase n=1 Tax=Ktedonospora formicarum TaxID=2778364 RepID=A0A8J3MTP4_9CHLR|nr:HAMP domain-containing sensor histidine kinase [Ktedonospora formicarum]GHO45808.1 hypothetical protein KSX_39710 [Ktedonospora formicarum]
MWTPFCFVTVVAGFIWGVGPALFTVALGFFAFNIFVVPQYDLLTSPLWNDFKYLAPFVIAQFAIALLAAQHHVQYRRALAAEHKMHTYARDLEVANQQLERASHLKDQFLIRAAHELRTPLTTILGEAQLALRRLQKDTSVLDMLVWKRHFEKIRARAETLHTLVEDLINLSGLSSEDMPLRMNSCDVSSICQEAIEEQGTFTGRTLIWKGPPAPLILQADAERLYQVVTNLIKNAIQYSPRHSVIHVTLNTEASSMLLQVHNAGPALPREQQDLFFEPFYRAPSAEAMNREGWGLGLTICKEIVVRHQGHIWITSSEDHGVTCSVSIPFKKEE